MYNQKKKLKTKRESYKRQVNEHKEYKTNMLDDMKRRICVRKAKQQSAKK